MIEWGGDKIGWPWRGLLRSSTGKITSPAGVEVNWPGRDGMPTLGMCSLIKIDGTQDPETTPEEAAAGMTWSSYALLSGGERFIYGRMALGFGAGVIYVAPDGTPWLVRTNARGNFATRHFYADIEVRRFGYFDAPRVAGSVFSKSLSAQFASFADVSGSSGSFAFLSVSKNGERVLLGVRRHGGQATIVVEGGASRVNLPNAMAAVAEIRFSGSPGDGTFNAAMSVLWDEADVADLRGLVTGADYTWDAERRLGVHRKYMWDAPPMKLDSGDYPSSPGSYLSDSGVRFLFDGSRYASSAEYWVAPTEEMGDPGFLEDGVVHSVGAPASKQEVSLRVLYGARFRSDGVAEPIFRDYKVIRTLSYTVDSTPIVLSVVSGPPSNVPFSAHIYEREENKLSSPSGNSVCYNEVTNDVTGLVQPTYGTWFRLDVDVAVRLFDSSEYEDGASFNVMADFSHEWEWASLLTDIHVSLINAIPPTHLPSTDFGDAFAATLPRPKFRSGAIPKPAFDGIDGSLLVGDVVGRQQIVPPLKRRLFPGDVLYASDHPLTGEVAQDTDGYCVWV